MAPPPGDSAAAVSAAATALAQRVEEALAKVEGSDKDPGERVKLLGPLIEAQRAALDGAGFESFAAYEAAVQALQPGGAPEAESATARLARAEARWASLLGGLEEQANCDLSMPLRSGDAAPPMDLVEAKSGAKVSLPELLSEGPSSVLLLFMRHFGWVPWRDHVAELVKKADRLKELRCTVVVVTFNPDCETGQRWNREVGSPFLQLLDPACPGSAGDAGAAYRAWGFRKSFAGVWSSTSLRFYSDQKLSGHKLHPSLGQDPHRMGGDVLLDGSGTVVLPYYSKTNTDRPAVEATLLPLLEALDGQRRASGRAGTGPLRALQLMALGAAAVHGVRWCEDRQPRQRPFWSTLVAGGLVAAACLAAAAAQARSRLGPARGGSWAVEPLAPPAAPRAECKTWK